MSTNRTTRLDDETLATDLAVLGDDAGVEPQVGDTGAEKRKPAETDGADAAATSGTRPNREVH